MDESYLIISVAQLIFSASDKVLVYAIGQTESVPSRSIKRKVSLKSQWQPSPHLISTEFEQNL
jgi:hypothetical protein